MRTWAWTSLTRPVCWHDGRVENLMDSARRVIVVGDEGVAGFGDPRYLGWVGRVLARSGGSDPSQAILTMTLATPGETTSELGERWEREVAPRLGSAQQRIVLAPGAHDIAAGISLARSRLNIANILDATSSAGIPALMVGAPPRNDLDPARQQELSAAFADVCLRRRIPYIETYAPLAEHPQWHTDLAAGDGIHPGQTGYGLLAWLVLHHGWHEWLGVPVPE